MVVDRYPHFPQHRNASGAEVPCHTHLQGQRGRSATENVTTIAAAGIVAIVVTCWTTSGVLHVVNAHDHPTTFGHHHLERVGEISRIAKICLIAHAHGDIAGRQEAHMDGAVLARLRVSHVDVREIQYLVLARILGKGGPVRYEASMTGTVISAVLNGHPHDRAPTAWFSIMQGKSRMTGSAMTAR